jgi:hypothetical protein
MKFLGANIGNCPHTEGLYKAARIAQMGGYNVFICKANSSSGEILEAIQKFNPNIIGFSYRLTPEIGFIELFRILKQIEINGLANKPNGQPRKFVFAGLPATIAILIAKSNELPVPVIPVQQLKNPIEQIEQVFTIFEFSQVKRKTVLDELKDELFPPRLQLLDHLADLAINDEKYQSVTPLPVPSLLAQRDLITRMNESSYPILRSHFGVPSDSIQPTIEGIREISNARVIDEISIGSSDLSQRYYGKPEEFKKRKNDGGVPYKDKDDLRQLFFASRTGNYPSCKPYAHTMGILDFIDDCIESGMLIGAHQAIPLYWFNQLDGRGSTPVYESIKEHIAAVKKLANLGIPVEMNDPNQWSSRYAHDTIVVADYGIITAVMIENGVKNIVLQMQFNKPIETGDFGDIAKMKTAAHIARNIGAISSIKANYYHETRTGIEYFSTDLKYAKWQLARSTLLQLILNPSIIHLVSYCEAIRAANPNDIIESSKIIRYTVDIFKQYEPEIRKIETDPIVLERMEFLNSEAEFLLKKIAKLDKEFNNQTSITKFLSNHDTIYKSIKTGLMAAPGIMNPDFKNEKLITKPMRNGFINAVDYDSGLLLHESDRLSH